MKILQLTHKPPVPAIDGGCLAMRQITTCLLNAGVEVKVVSLATAKHPVVLSEEFIEYCNKTQFESVSIDTKVTIPKAITSFLKRTSLQADRFFSKEMVQKLETLFAQEKFDVIILESVFVGGYIETIRKHSDARILLRVHNIEYLIWKRLSKQEKNPVKKMAYRYLSNSLKRFELALFKKIDGYMPITEVDYLFFKEKYPALPGKVIPFGIDLSVYQHENRKIDANKISLFHIGSMNWQPNIEGMTWFLENVWKQVAEKHPKLTLALAGKDNKAIFGNITLNNVQIFDFVESAQQFINEHDIMIVPLLSGSGMRIKIMEGLALGKPIITTTIGAEGIEITDKENIFIANTTEAMVQTIDFCVNHIEKCEEIGKNARKLIESKYAQEIITKDFMAILDAVSL
ncbi:MAG: glycosyltransferase family 4 protein [Bacteroidetes bacterium]|nr:glycosyltransferase family 4 protein [Bacteroidota bacterium]MCL2303685.1 glycosyltransferase family 4 protein [Lentimicrobiaceae bacterium]